jgi:hypothetical protein
MEGLGIGQLDKRGGVGFGRAADCPILWALTDEEDN